MEMCKLLYDGLIISVESLMLVNFLRNSLEQKVHSVIILINIIFLQLIRRLVFKEIGALSLIPSILIDIVVISILCHGHFLKKAFLVTLFYALIFICDSTSVLMIAFVRGICGKEAVNVDHYIFPATILSKALTLLVVLILRDYLRKTESRITEWLKYMLIPVFIVTALVWESPYSNDVYNTEVAKLLVIICVFSFISAFILIISIIRKYENRQLQYRLEAINGYKELRKDHYNEIHAAYRQIEQTAHDFKHHLDYIEAAPDIAAIKKYVRVIKRRCFSQVLRFTGNFDIDTILNSKHNEMRSKGISLTVHNTLPVDIGWLDPVDICILLGNGLSNAIEACLRCNGKSINVVFKHDPDWMLITIENPTNEHPIAKKTGSGLVSSKHSNKHGIGMESMLEAVKRYDGYIKHTVINGTFILDILIQSTK